MVAGRAKIPAVVLPFTVGGSEGAQDLFGLFDDTLARLTGALCGEPPRRARPGGRLGAAGAGPLSFSVGRGEIVALAGPNGRMSTVFAALAGEGHVSSPGN